MTYAKNFGIALAVVCAMFVGLAFFVRLVGWLVKACPLGVVGVVIVLTAVCMAATMGGPNDTGPR